MLPVILILHRRQRQLLQEGRQGLQVTPSLEKEHTSLGREMENFAFPDHNSTNVNCVSS